MIPSAAGRHHGSLADEPLFGITFGVAMHVPRHRTCARVSQRVRVPAHASNIVAVPAIRLVGFPGRGSEFRVRLARCAEVQSGIRPALETALAAFEDDGNQPANA